MTNKSLTDMTVVVPVYNAFAAVTQCLSALEKHTPKTTSVFLIDDASSDGRIAPLLADYGQRNGWQVRSHRINQGFVRTANEGLRHSSGHTILLNADAIVTPHWLNAFHSVIDNVENLATATPWSNNAEICSFPAFLQASPVLPEREELATALYELHSPRYPEIPTGVGFCLLVTAQAKEKVGGFDEQAFGHGYGEENDFCLRATAAGLTNVLVDNAYVAHIGNQSFAELGMQPGAESMRRLLAKHPHYAQLIHDYIQADPLSSLRCEIIQGIKENRPKLAARLLDLLADGQTNR
jgi:GT2 family glycosyltransferase